MQLAGSTFALKASKLPGLLSRETMVGRGAYGYLSMAVECEVPVDLVEVLSPLPVCPNWGTYSTVDVESRIVEMKYSVEDDRYLLFSGAACLDAAKRAGQRTIRAFVEPDQGKIGSALHRGS